LSTEAETTYDTESKQASKCTHPLSGVKAVT
jgi:hypothetical protein